MYVDGNSPREITSSSPVHIKALKCRECGEEYLPIQIYICEECFGPLEVIYDYDVIKLTKESFQKRIKTLWRYFELLPIIDKAKVVDLGDGFTPLHKCERLGREIGVRKLYVKNDTVNPTGSFKDRPAGVAVSKALEFNTKVVGCPSTGNLADAVAAHAAKAGLPCYLLVPSDIEKEKILHALIHGANVLLVEGSYDDANRLAIQVAEEFGWSFVNINLRPYYMEGSKSLAFEICEQLNWRAPENIIVPTASGGLLYATWKALRELKELKLIEELPTRIICAQPEGCSPIVDAFKEGKSTITPVEQPKTIAKSLAIGNPADGIYALRIIRESRGVAEIATDPEIKEAIKLLASKEGIFAEPAGAITIAVLKKLVESGQISSDEEVVCLVTGSGFKSLEIMPTIVGKFVKIKPNLEELKKTIEHG
jgi:threonine synthase